VWWDWIPVKLTDLAEIWTQDFPNMKKEGCLLHCDIHEYGVIWGMARYEFLAVMWWTHWYKLLIMVWWTARWELLVIVCCNSQGKDKVVPGPTAITYREVEMLLVSFLTRWSWTVSFMPLPLWLQRRSLQYPLNRRLRKSETWSAYLG